MRRWRVQAPRAAGLCWAALLLGGCLAAALPGPWARGLQGLGCLASSGALVVLAWSQRWRTREPASAAYARRLALGMSAGLLGDLCMAAGVVLGGLGFFGLGHAAYLTAMLRLAQTAALGRWRRRAALWGLGLAGGFGLWYGLVLHGGGTRAAASSLLVGAALAYTALLASTAGVAAGLAAADRRFCWLALGAALFLASDAVVAARLFRPALLADVPDWLRAGLVWLTYGPAQRLVVGSASAAAALRQEEGA